jgi:hypothetical protein
MTKNLHHQFRRSQFRDKIARASKKISDDLFGWRIRDKASPVGLEVKIQEMPDGITFNTLSDRH